MPRPPPRATEAPPPSTGILYRDIQTGEIAWAINWFALLGLILATFFLFALAVLFGDDVAVGLLPQHWFVHADTSAGTRTLDVLEYGFSFVFKLLFYSGLSLSGCILVHHMLFGKKRPRRKREKGGEDFTGH